MTRPIKIHGSRIVPGDLIAVALDGTGCAWQLADVEQHPDRYEWRTVRHIQRGTVHLDKGGCGLNGAYAIVKR